MSWNDVFPVLGDDLLSEFRAGVGKRERVDFEAWFGVARIIRPRGAGVHASEQSEEGVRLEERVSGKPRHVVSATLFWKHVGGADPDLPVPTREILVDAARLGLVKRFSPWESYVQPLIDHTEEAVRKYPQVEFRLYLAADLEFLADELVELGWTVYLMKSPSLRYCPGGFWRFLALGDKDVLVTVIDTDRMNLVGPEIERTILMHEIGLGLWRVPGYYNAPLDQLIRYRPILGGHFGARGGLPVRRLIEAFVWHARRGTLRLTANIPGQGERLLQFAHWPDYGFDESFQLAVLYPRLIKQGTLTFIPTNAQSLLLPLDIEYVTWANSRSEIIYFQS